MTRMTPAATPTPIPACEPVLRPLPARLGVGLDGEGVAVVEREVVEGESLDDGGFGEPTFIPPI